MDQDQFAADPFDPSSWKADEHEYRIYASNDPEFYVVVDQEDYAFLAQFSWSIHTYHNGRAARTQLYLRRSISDFYAPDGPMYESLTSGKLVRNRKRVQRNLFLHFVVMLRKGDIPPDKHHHIVDHDNRNTRNCRRSNIRWATWQTNNLNK
jgi:hypothetical protein